MISKRTYPHADVRPCLVFSGPTRCLWWTCSQCTRRISVGPPEHRGTDVLTNHSDARSTDHLLAQTPRALWLQLANSLLSPTDNETATKTATQVTLFCPKTSLAQLLIKLPPTSPSLEGAEQQCSQAENIHFRPLALVGRQPPLPPPPPHQNKLLRMNSCLDGKKNTHTDTSTLACARAPSTPPNKHT